MSGDLDEIRKGLSEAENLLASASDAIVMLEGDREKLTIAAKSALKLLRSMNSERDAKVRKTIEELESALQFSSTNWRAG